jgi:peptidoglycan/xylan/chitin deacetylase (PgdA/CDA1 family)
LDDYDIKGSFFIPGATVEKYPDMVAEIVRRGHEVGNHGYTHMCPDSFEDRAAEAKEYYDTNAAIKKITGNDPKGFRAPSWEFSVNTLGILKEMGFLYDSSQMGSDQVTWLEVFGEQTNIAEIPINWTLDDAPFWLLSLHTWGAPMPSPNAVYESWSEEFLYLYEESFDNIFDLTCHPQIIGRPGRMRMYERLVKFLKEHEHVQFVRCIDAAEEYLASV